MNVVSIKKKLLEGKFPGQPGATLNLNDKQIKYLVATVPCVKIYNKNATQYYFIEAGTYLQVHFYGGMGRYTTNGSMFEVSYDYAPLKYEDGIRKFPINEDKKPLIFKIHERTKAHQLGLVLQRALWLNKMPYEISIDGYGSVHKKGWPKNTQFGLYSGLKTSLSINDNDYETIYLIHDDLPSNHQGDGLKEAILNGEFDGSEAPDVFRERISKKAQEEHKALKHRLEFENFVRKDPLQQINDGIKNYNDEIDTYKKFLKMATVLRKKMKENPGWFKKVKKVRKDHGQKNSTLFKETERIKAIMENRHNTIDKDNEGLHRAIVRAVEE